MRTYMSDVYSTNRLKGLGAIVTGANTGIGRSIAIALGYEGAKVAINYVSQEEEADRTIKLVKERGPKAFKIKADVTNEDEVKAMFAIAIKEMGTVDILVNNAGIQSAAPFIDMTLEQWQKVIDVNLTGSFLCSREAVKEFLRRGMVRTRSCCVGKIIFVSSVHQVIPWAGHCNYAASKGGMMMLMKSIAQELAPHKIRVNGIAPGAIKTPMNKSAWETPEAQKEMQKLIPYGKVGEPIDVGAVAAWLASDESEYVHGTTVFVDGGMTLYPGVSTGG